MKIAIQQPEHIPWIGFFNKMAACDMFVCLDNVQFKKRYFENRNKIKTREEAIWVTVPVQTKNRFTQNISEVIVEDPQTWRRKYSERLKHSYGKHPFWNDVEEIVFPVLDQPLEKLADMNIALIENIRRYLGISTPMVRASEVVSENLMGSERIFEICRRLNADDYVSGPDGEKYLDLERFENEAIRISYHKFEHPVYLQRGEDFISHLSILDLIANCGQNSLGFVKNDCQKEFHVATGL